MLRIMDTAYNKLILPKSNCNLEQATTRAVLNFFWPPASRAGKVEKLPARIETYQPKKKKKIERGTFFVVVHMTAFLGGSLRSREYGRSA